MNKIKNIRLFTVFLVLAVGFYFPGAFTKAEDVAGSISAQYQSIVSDIVKNILDSVNTETATINEQIKAIVAEQNNVIKDVTSKINIIQRRNSFKTFLIGTDYKNIGQLRSDMEKTGNQINQLSRLLDQSINDEVKTSLQTQINALEQQQQKIDNFLKTNENKFSLFGWFVKLFNK